MKRSTTKPTSSSSTTTMSSSISSDPTPFQPARKKLPQAVRKSLFAIREEQEQPKEEEMMNEVDDLHENEAAKILMNMRNPALPNPIVSTTDDDDGKGSNIIKDNVDDVHDDDDGNKKNDGRSSITASIGSKVSDDRNIVNKKIKKKKVYRGLGKKKRGRTATTKDATNNNKKARVIAASSSSSSTAGPSSAPTFNPDPKQKVSIMNVPKKIEVKRVRKNARRRSDPALSPDHPDWVRRSIRTNKVPERLQASPKKNTQQEYYITQVIYSRDVARKGNKMKQYLVKWWGHFPKPTWVPPSQLTGCAILLKLHNAHMAQFALWLEALNLNRLVRTIRERGNLRLQAQENEYFKDFMLKFVIQPKAYYSNWELYHLFNYDRYTEACSQGRADEEGTDEKYGTDDLVSILKYTRRPMRDYTV